MRSFILLVLATALVAGCGARGVERKATAVANENVKTVAGALMTLEQLKNATPFGELLFNQTEVMDAVLDLTLEEKAEFQPTIDEAKLTSGSLQDLQDEVAKSAKDTADAKKEVDEAQAAGFWGWVKDVFTWGGWGAVGLGLAWAAHVAAGAIPALKPLQLVTGPLLNRVPLVGGALKGQEKLKTAAATIESSEVGRVGLQLVDSRLPAEWREKLGAALGAMTGGKATTLEGYFKHLAKGHAVDHASVSHEDVRGLLEEVRTLMPTKDGVPVELADLLKESDVISVST